MKNSIEIPLTKGKFAIIDKCDLEFVMRFKWAVHGRETARYAITNNKRIATRMHDYIMDCPDGLIVDHINGNGLDNRRNNLRICTELQNKLNRKKQKSSTNTYKGVSKDGKKWRASIAKSKKVYFLGKFNTEIEAAKAYNNAAKIHHGEFANINKFPIEPKLVLNFTVPQAYQA